MIIVALVAFGIGIFVGSGRLAAIRFPWNKNIVATGLPATLNYSSVNQVYQALKNNYDGKLTETQLLNGIKEGLAAAPGDPYTEYFTPRQAKEFNNELNNTFSGIGAELSQTSSGEIEIIAPIKGTPAASAGLQPHDIIVGINGKSTTGMNIDTAVNEIRGRAGTKVVLTILRGSQTLNLTITREDITVPSVMTKILPGNIGYMSISTFANDTSSLAEQAAQQFKNDHVKGIILDLRSDPGGLLSAAINVSSLWVTPNQEILQERRGNKILQTYYAEGGDILHGIPTVVLINGGSASASEITTGALHDNHDAYVIGTKSFGKGVVQQLINFKDGAELKVTVASWYRPDGQDIEHKGIIPDKIVQDKGTDLQSANDPQLKAAEAYLAKH